MTIHDELVKKCLPLIKSYQNDLLVHDKNEIEFFKENTPFIHITREMGTHMISLIHPEMYPEGKVPYLFGHADKYHICKQKICTIDHIEKNNDYLKILYFDGHELTEKTISQAREIVQSYIDSTINTFGNKDKILWK